MVTIGPGSLGKKARDQLPGTEEPIDERRGWSACWGAADDLGQVRDRRRPKQTVTEF